MTFAKVAISISLGIAIALAGVVAGQATSSAMDAAANIPENASPKGYGIGWECDRGYRADAGQCRFL
jgi:F0F1-type ATP synthase membrane subunit c/vacuolar-type H+-ATPase subunit K